MDLLKAIIIFCTVLFTTCIAQNRTLTFVHVLYRHGDRTPVKPYANDPWKNESNWPVGWGQLTNIGKQQQFELGTWLRSRYDSLISKGYSKNLTYIQSTDVDRTLMSAESNLAGLFPPNIDQRWAQDINWQPIPIHTIPENLDEILAAKRPCPAYDSEWQRYLNSKEYLALLDKHKELFKYLSEWSGEKVESFENVRSLYSTMYIETLYNKTLPDWTKKVFPGDMQWITDQSFAEDTNTTLMKRLKGGFLLKDILHHFQNKSKSILDPDRSMWIYSAHDTTIAHLLNTLGIFDPPHFPPYASCVMLELWMENGKPFIEIYYRKSTADPIQMNIPSCGSKCPLEKMFEIYRDILPGDFKDECQQNMIAKAYDTIIDGSTSSGAILTIIVLCSLLCLALVIAIFAKIFKKRFYQIGRMSDSDKDY